MKMFRILVIGVILLVSFNPLLFAEEAGDLRSEVQALREELKALKTELETLKVTGKEAVEKGTQKEASAKETVTQDDLQGVRAEVETLRDEWKKTIAGDYGADTKVPVTSRSLTLGGIVQGRYALTEGKSPVDGFSIPALILSFRGSLRKDYEFGRNLDYVFSLSSDSTDSFMVKPLDAYLSYSVLPSNNLEKPRLSLVFGQQKKPFGREPQATEEYKPTIKAAQFDSKLGLGTRDIGLVANGDLFPFVDYGFNYRVPLIEYSLGVINGAGPNGLDDNNQKDYAGRLVLNAPSDYNSIFRGLSLGGSYYTGNKSLTSGTTRRREEKKRLGADLAYVRTPIGFTAEYAWGEDSSLIGVTRPVTYVTKGEGYAASVFYNFGQQFVRGFKSQTRYDDWYPLTYQPFVRFDRWDPNIEDQSDDRTDIYTLGFNWFFAETTKLQLNYNIIKEQSNRVDNNEFLAQFQYGF